MITSAVNVGSTIPGLYAIDKWGRRPLLFWGAVGMAVSQLIVAATGVTSTGQTAEGVVYATNIAGQRAAIAFVCIFIFFFASTWVCISLPRPSLVLIRLRDPSAGLSLERFSHSRSAQSACHSQPPAIGCSTGPLPTLHLTWSTTVLETPICNPTSSGSGSDAASCVSAGHTL